MDRVLKRVENTWERHDTLLVNKGGAAGDPEWLLRKFFTLGVTGKRGLAHAAGGMGDGAKAASVMYLKTQVVGGQLFHLSTKDNYGTPTLALFYGDGKVAMELNMALDYNHISSRMDEDSPDQLLVRVKEFYAGLRENVQNWQDNSFERHGAVPEQIAPLDGGACVRKLGDDFMFYTGELKIEGVIAQLKAMLPDGIGPDYVVTHMGISTLTDRRKGRVVHHDQIKGARASFDGVRWRPVPGAPHWEFGAGNQQQPKIFINGMALEIEDNSINIPITLSLTLPLQSLRVALGMGRDRKIRFGGKELMFFICSLEAEDQITLAEYLASSEGNPSGKLEERLGRKRMEFYNVLSYAIYGKNASAAQFYPRGEKLYPKLLDQGQPFLRALLTSLSEFVLGERTDTLIGVHGRSGDYKCVEVPMPLYRTLAADSLAAESLADGFVQPRRIRLVDTYQPELIRLSYQQALHNLVPGVYQTVEQAMTHHPDPIKRAYDQFKHFCVELDKLHEGASDLVKAKVQEDPALLTVLAQLREMPDGFGGMEALQKVITYWKPLECINPIVIDLPRGMFDAAWRTEMHVQITEENGLYFGRKIEAFIMDQLMCELDATAACTLRMLLLSPVEQSSAAQEAEAEAIKKRAEAEEAKMRAEAEEAKKRAEAEATKRRAEEEKKSVGRKRNIERANSKNKRARLNADGTKRPRREEETKGIFGGGTQKGMPHDRSAPEPPPDGCLEENVGESMWASHGSQVRCVVGVENSNGGRRSWAEVGEGPGTPADCTFMTRQAIVVKGDRFSDTLSNPCGVYPVQKYVTNPLPPKMQVSLWQEGSQLHLTIENPDCDDFQLYLGLHGQPLRYNTPEGLAMLTPAARGAIIQITDTPYDPDQPNGWAQKMCAERCASWLDSWEGELKKGGISCSNATVLVPGNITNCLHAAIILTSSDPQMTQQMVHCGPNLEPRERRVCCDNCVRCTVCKRLYG